MEWRLQLTTGLQLHNRLRGAAWLWIHSIKDYQTCALATFHSVSGKKMLPPAYHLIMHYSKQNWLLMIGKGVLNKSFIFALAGVAQWIECWPVNKRVTGFSSQSGHMPGFGARSPIGGAWEATTHWCFSPSLFPSLPLSQIHEISKKYISCRF